MNRSAESERLFAIWAPEGSAWSDWAKPVLFAHAPQAAREDAAAPPPALDLAGVPDASERHALVVDLPGAASVEAGLALAERGWRPVPLFNAASSVLERSTVETGAVARALAHGAARLERLSLHAEAPPAFLLDSLRMRERVTVGPGVFDNRWMVFPQDLPSGNLLRSRRIEHALWLGAADAWPSEDLAHVLLRWREQGLSLWRRDPADPARTVELSPARPRRFRWVLMRWLALAGLRRNSAGGFGSVVPTPSHGSGFHGFA